MKIYISGRIKGLDLENAQRIFKEAQTELEALGLGVVNPLEIAETHEPAEREDWHACMLIDIEHLFKCEAIYMLYNWQASKGARIEHAIARASDMDIYYQASILPQVISL